MVKIAGGLLKLIALVGGACISVLSLMAIIGTYTDNGWARGGIAVLLALIVPLIFAEGALAKVSPSKVKGVTTDVLAICYLGFALVFVGVAHSYTRPMLESEGQRLASSGMKRMSRAAYFLAGGRSPEVTAAPTLATTPSSPTAPAEKSPPVAAKPPELRAGDGKERTPAELFTEFAPSVVTIMVKGPMGEGGGTGFIIDANGTVGTNYHVIQHATEIKVKLMDGTIASEVEILVENEPNDLALLSIKSDKKLPPVALGDSDKITVGERAVSIGNPVGLEHTLTDGLISARRVIEGRKMIQMSTPVSPGNSGGPLFNSKGEVIGITTAIFMGGSFLAQNLNLAMPVNDLRAMLRTDYPGRHKAGDSSSRGGRW
ncbi:MAG: trypsin-like peptidase domain-containing protein [Deltaproteobacteria bacterium]|nr:trypsin-like peptidase domain-containing protein [Deltaproteobacteria bacterium]